MMLYILYFIDIREFLEKQDDNERTRGRNAQQCKKSAKIKADLNHETSHVWCQKA